MYDQIVKEKLEEEEFNGFMLKTDMALVETWAAKKNASISFRSAGNDTLRCLERGAGAKPHKILDKSLKKKILKDTPEPDVEDKQFNDAVDAFFAGFGDKEGTAEDLLMGLVGHWNKLKTGGTEVDGLYLTELGKEELSKSGLNIAGADTPTPYLLLADAGQKKALINFFKDLPGSEKYKLYRFTRLFYSGDYDTHDLLQARSAVASSSDILFLECLRQDMLNCRIAYLMKWHDMTQADIDEEKAKERKKDGIIESDYCRIQHGPQFNYTAQMANENLAIFLKAIEDKKDDLDGLNVLANKIMNMDRPVAMCNGLAGGNGNWSILDGPKEMRDFYGNLGQEIKSTWRDQVGRDERIIHLFCSVIHYIFGATGQRRNFDTDKKKREKVEKILSGYKDMYHDENKKVNGKTQYETYLLEALNRTFKA